MRVLLVSHTVLSTTGNMGKTLKAYLSSFSSGEVAQFYIHSEVPTDDAVCLDYYRFTDVDALKSILLRNRQGTCFNQKDIRTDLSTTRVDTGLTGSLYHAGGRRGCLTMSLRELVWLFGKWNTPGFRKWMTDMAPDVILYAAGDYMFTYRIARKLSEMLQKPLALVCVDDFYFYNRNHSSILGRVLYRFYMREVHRTMKQTSILFTICDSMAEKYGKLFGLPCHVLHTGAQRHPLSLLPDAEQISYIGNLELGRHQQLITLASVLQKIDPSRYLDVYSGTTDPKLLHAIQNAPGIRFHGSIPADEVLRVMERSMAVIHTESFDEQMQHMVRFSVSTKIAESLMYGPCLLAYGPEGIASIDYLKEHNAAYVITDQDDPEAALRKFLNDRELRETILKNARALAQQNHDLSRNSELVYHTLQTLCGT